MKCSPTLEPPHTPWRRAYPAWLALALVPAMTACSQPPAKVSDAARPPASTPAEPRGAAAKAPEAAEPPTPEAADLPPDGWTRLDLSTVMPSLTGTIDLPQGITAQAAERQEIDAEGLEAEARGVHLGPRVSGATLEAMTDIPPRFASAAAMARFHGQFEHVSTHEFGPGHWAVVQRWRPGECMLHGWSTAAGLTCDVFKAPCEEMAQWVRVCGSLQPGDAPNESPTTARSAFPELELAVAELAMTVARAVVRNDVPMLLGTLGPKGLKIGKKTYTAESLQAALADQTVLRLVAPIYGDLEDDPGSLFNWNSGPSSRAKPRSGSRAATASRPTSS